jgi:eukaryotic-like serine/threonine-protein kinase
MKRSALLFMTTSLLFLVAAGCGKSPETATIFPPETATSAVSTNTPEQFNEIQQTKIPATPILQSGETLPTTIVSSTPTNTAHTPQALELDIGSIMISPIDQMIMVYVPEGGFTMGVDDGEMNEGPQHIVYLDSYWIDQHEVTNQQYRLCQESGACKPPLAYGTVNRAQYYNHPEGEYDDYPVTNITWAMADAYCSWAGRRLPTEAEWEKAARGSDGRKFSWGDDGVAKNLLNFYAVTFNDGYPEATSPVGHYPDGASPYGADDMMGNVWEFTADWYEKYYYQESPTDNPTGPRTGKYRVIRGGSWASTARDISVYNRGGAKMETTEPFIGFRCAAEVQ